MSRAALLLLAACGRVQPPGGDSTIVDTDTTDGEDGGETDPPAPTCVDGRGEAPAGLPEPFTDHRGMAYRLIQLDHADFDELWAIVGWPAEGATAIAEGAPVVLALPPALDLSPKWVTDPSLYFSGEVGMIVVEPVYPGWTVQGATTSGSPDGGATRSAEAAFAALEWAAGRSTSQEGWRLEQVVGVPACVRPIAMMATSGGGVPAALLLDAHAEELGTDLLGLAAFEVPSLPIFTVTDLGTPWMDPDEQADDDANGIAWDEGRNPTYAAGDCTAAGCALYYSGLSWDPAIVAGEIWPNGAGTDPGIFFLDRNQSGGLEVGPDGRTTDLDGDGQIGADEDAYFIPHIDDHTDPTHPVQVYSSELLAAAEAQALFPPGTWPAHVSTAAQVVDYWAERDMIAHTAALEGRLPSWFAVDLIYSAEPHAVAQVDRPNERLYFEALDGAGIRARYNTTVEVARCAAGAGADLGEWTPAGDWGEALSAEEMADHAFEETVSSDDMRAAGTLQLFWSAWGPVDHCRG